jgi:hypothetical protein
VAHPGGSELGQEGRVNNHDLKNADLAGMLPPSLPSLAALRDLSLQGNSLSGALPSFRGMASLRRRKWRRHDNTGRRRRDAKILAFAGGRGREAGAVYTPLLIVSRDWRWLHKFL